MCTREGTGARGIIVVAVLELGIGGTTSSITSSTPGKYFTLPGNLLERCTVIRYSEYIYRYTCTIVY